MFVLFNMIANILKENDLLYNTLHLNSIGIYTVT